MGCKMSVFIPGITLSEHLSSFRADRPSEWLMDEFIRDAKELEQQIATLRERSTAAAFALVEYKTAALDGGWNEAGCACIGPTPECRCMREYRLIVEFLAESGIPGELVEKYKTQLGGE